MAFGCFRCRTPVPEGAAFCTSCGAAVGAGCAQCRRAVPAYASFCPSCGTEIGTAENGPETIKLVTVLFADVVGSTAQAEQMTPDEVRRLMSEFFGAMIEEITAEGGTVERVIGDALMADFGVPVSREDDAIRAVRAGVRMLRRLEVFNDGRSPTERVSIRIGINTGHMSTGGRLGDRLMVMGDAVNVAARLEQAAQPGTILIGERTAALVSAQFRLREIPPLAVRGKSEPLSAFVVEEQLEHPRSELRMPLVGRERELDELHRCLEVAEQQRRPTSTVLVGDAGVGKTRLLTEFLARVHQRTKILFGRCAGTARLSPLGPLSEILRSEAGIAPDDPLSTIDDKLSRLLHRAGGGTATAGGPMAGAMAATLGVGLEGSDRAGNPREIHRQVLGGWTSLLSNLAEQAPVVIALDDLHMADALLFDVLTHVAREASGPILFVGTARPASGQDAPSGLEQVVEASKTICLDPLSGDASRALVNEVLATRSIPNPLRERVIERSGGNPLFIHEIVLQLLEGGGRGIPADRADLDVPDRVQGVIQARLDLLPERHRRVIQHAAVIGSFFPKALLTAVTGREMVEASLAELKRRELVRERALASAEGDWELAFTHVLIRDVAYESLPRRERGRVHGQAARWLEREAHTTNGAIDGIAHHFVKAYEHLGTRELATKGRSYSFAAAERSLQRFALDTAATHARQALALSDPGLQKVEALESIGDLYSFAHASEGAYSSYVEAVAELKASGRDSDRSLARLAAKAGIVGTRYWGTMARVPVEEELRKLIEEGLRAAGEESSEPRALLLASRGFGYNLGYAFCDDGADAARAALAIAQTTGDADLESVCADAVCATLFRDGSWDEFYELASQRVRLVPRLTSIREICDAYGIMSVLSMRKGLYEDAARYAGHEVEQARHVDPGSHVQGTVFRMIANLVLGEWDQVFEDEQEIDSTVGKDDPSPLTLRAYAVAALCHFLRGDVRPADAFLRLYETYIERQEDLGFEAGAPPELALMLALRGDTQRARSLVDSPRGDYYSLHREFLCEILRIAEAWDDAAHTIAGIRKESSEHDLRGLTYFADRLEAAMIAATGEPAPALPLLARAAEGFAALGARWEEAQTRALAADWLGSTDTDAAETEARLAEALFDQLGVSPGLRGSAGEGVGDRTPIDVRRSRPG